MIRVSTRSARLGATLVLSLLLLAPSASAVPPQGGEANDAIVEFVESDNNKDYDPKTESEGSEWEYDPAEVDLTSGESDSGTNFQGARILEGNVEVVMESGPFVGDSEDTESTRYANWQGSTLFFGAQDAETANKVDGIAEFGRSAPNVNLAVSLNATTQEVRDKIMPGCRRWPARATPRAQPADDGRRQL